MARYYEATGATRKELLAIYAKRDEGFKQATAMMKRLGADSWLRQAVWGSELVTGFEFKDASKVDRKLFKQIKGWDSYYEPRLSSKAGKALKQEMMGIDLGGTAGIGEAIGFKRGLKAKGRGVTLTGRAGLEIFGNRAIVKIEDDEGEPNGDCKRISDLAVERLRNKYDKPKRKRA